MKLGLKYGSQEALDWTNCIFGLIFRAAVIESNSLAKEFGPFPKYKDCVWDSEIIKKHFMQEEIDVMRQYGLRNCSLISIAPTGSIATCLGESGGCEPEFALSFTRRTVGMTDGEDTYYKVYCKAAREYMELYKCEEKDLPDYFVSSANISWKDRVLTQSVMQDHVDTAISSTVNLPNEATKEDIAKLYLLAWEKGLKGITIFRNGCKRVPILSTETSKKEEEAKEKRKLERGEIKVISDDVIGKKRRLISGCVDGETEFFTGYGWKKISEYKKGDKVLQYNADGTASLVEPLDYIKRKSAGQYHIVSKYGIDMMVSPDHRNVVFNDFNNDFNIMTTEEIIKQHNELKCGFYKKFKLSFNYNGKGINLTDDEIRISVAIFADGCFYSPTSKKVLISVRKKRKRNRLIMLLENAGIDYNENLDRDGYYNIKFYPPIEGRVKQFPEEWYNCSQHQLQVIFDEVFKWDGYEKNNNEYTTVIKSNADFIQFVCAATGHRGSIYIDSRFDKYTEKSYRVDWSDRTKAGIQEKKKKQIEFVEDVDYDYCFSVPSTMLVLRRNNRIFITGNCGSLHCAAYFDRTTGELLEVFLDKGSTGGCDNFMTGLSRMISLAARAGCSVYDIVDQLNSSGTCPSYAVRRATKHDTSPGSSCPVAVGNALLDMQIEINEELEIDNPKPIIKKKETKSVILPKYKCPECGSEITFEGGCQTCKNCGWSKCN